MTYKFELFLIIWLGVLWFINIRLLVFYTKLTHLAQKLNIYIPNWNKNAKTSIIDFTFFKNYKLRWQ